MNIGNFEEFKKHLEKYGKYYTLRKDYENIESKYKNEIQGLHFAALYGDTGYLNRLQKDLGEDVVLFMYSHPGRDYGDIYCRGHEDECKRIEKDLIDSMKKDSEFNSFKDSFKDLLNNDKVKEDTKMHILLCEFWGLNKLKDKICEEIPGTVFIDLSCPYGI